MIVWIVCGGRVGRNLTEARVWAVLDVLAEDHPGERIIVVHGDAASTDRWSGTWAWKRGHAALPVKIDAALDGDLDDAPFNRNKRILAKAPTANACIGFPGGGGTFHMMNLCHDAGIPVADIELEHDDTWEVKWWPTKQS